MNKYEKRLHNNIPVCSATQVISKFFQNNCLLMKTIADIAMKPFSSEHLCQHLKVLETLNCFSTNTGPS